LTYIKTPHRIADVYAKANVIAGCNHKAWASQ
jgi:hypothetical protein